MELLCLLRLLSAIAFYSAATAEQLSVAPKSVRRCLIYLLLPRVDGRGGTFWLLVRDNQVPRGTFWYLYLCHMPSMRARWLIIHIKHFIIPLFKMALQESACIGFCVSSLLFGKLNLYPFGLKHNQPIIFAKYVPISYVYSHYAAHPTLHSLDSYYFTHHSTLHSTTHSKKR